MQEPTHLRQLTTVKAEYYNLKDHLGNVRVVFIENGSSGIAYIMQENHYYPFGMQMNGSWHNNQDVKNDYLYNGKELNTEIGLNWMDYGARYYDLAICNWLSVDPLSDMYSSHSPYNYTLNNPMIYIDPDGRSVWSKLGKAIYKVGKTVREKGPGALKESATYTDAFSGIIDDGRTVFDSEAGIGERVVAGISLASEVLPVSVGDVKDGANLVNGLADKLDDVKGTSRAARRESMRKAGIPTSQPLIPDKARNSKDKVYLTRDKKHTVQDAKNDSGHEGQLHWEAGPTKLNDNTPDGLNRSGTYKGSNKPKVGASVPQESLVTKK